MTFLDRIRLFFDKERLERASESAVARDASERDRIDDGAEGAKMDRSVMQGGGTVTPMLPVGPADDIDTAFERDSQAPPDEAP